MAVTQEKAVVYYKGLGTLSPKFSYAFFRIHYLKNSSCTETLHTESDAY